MNEHYKHDLIRSLLIHGEDAISDFLGTEIGKDIQEETVGARIKARMAEMSEEQLNRYYARYCNGIFVVVAERDQSEYTEGRHFESAAPAKEIVAAFSNVAAAEAYLKWLEENAGPYTDTPPIGWEEENGDEEYDPRSWHIEFIPHFLGFVQPPIEKTIPLWDDLTPRVYNLLMRANIKTVDDLVDAAAHGRLFKIRDCGRKAAEEICQKLLERTGKNYFERNHLKVPCR